LFDIRYWNYNKRNNRQNITRVIRSTRVSDNNMKLKQTMIISDYLYLFILFISLVYLYFDNSNFIIQTYIYYTWISPACFREKKTSTTTYEPHAINNAILQIQFNSRKQYYYNLQYINIMGKLSPAKGNTCNNHHNCIISLESSRRHPLRRPCRSDPKVGACEVKKLVLPKSN